MKLCAAPLTGFAGRDMSRPKIAIVAALPGELRPLVKNWSRLPQSQRAAFPRGCRVYVSERVVAIIGGMGSGPAEAAAEAAIRTLVPNLLISAGWAGALQPGIPVGDIIVPANVVEVSTGRNFSTLAGAGTLASVPGVLDPRQKAKLAETCSAQAVDMEAAIVAWLAREAGISFLAVKSVFDDPDHTVPGDRFRRSDGKFSYARFLAYSAMHPATWGSLPQMARNARLSARSLANVLNRIIACDSPTEIQQVVLEIIRNQK